MKKFMIWGHKLHTHTNSYVYYGYFRAFEYLGYTPYWFDNSDVEKVKDFDFNDTVIFTEGQVDQQVPLFKNIKYITHHCNPDKYVAIGCKQINLCNYVEPCERGISMNYNDPNNLLVKTANTPTVEKIRDFCFWDKKNNAIYQPWATDLLPHEIDVENPIRFNPNIPTVYYIGSTNHDNILPKFQMFAQCCQQNGKNIKVGQGNISFEENKKLIQNSYISVDIRGNWHQQCGYIPCRIWKNISYGKFTGTNSPHIGNILKGYIAYDNNPYTLFYTTEQSYASLSKENMKRMMLYVKENHTYINRAKILIEILGA